MSDVLFFNSIKLLKRMYFFPYFIRLLEHWGKFQSSHEKNKSVGIIMSLILEKVIMSDRHISDGQL